MRPNVIKKVEGGHGHHGGAWKVAYADFVTAMMALFIVLWLLASTDQETRKEISNVLPHRHPARGRSVDEPRRAVHAVGDRDRAVAATARRGVARREGRGREAARRPPAPARRHRLRARHRDQERAGRGDAGRHLDRGGRPGRWPAVRPVVGQARRAARTVPARARPDAGAAQPAVRDQRPHRRPSVRAGREGLELGPVLPARRGGARRSSSRAACRASRSPACSRAVPRSSTCLATRWPRRTAGCRSS